MPDTKIPLTVTRGHGLLKSLLANLRAGQANKLIDDTLRHGRILDIGCDSFPYFLSHASFSEKLSVDQQQPAQNFKDIQWLVLNLDEAPERPFKIFFWKQSPYWQSLNIET